MSRPRAWPALLLGGAVFAATALTLADPGITWDEPDYLHSARLEVAWLAGIPRHLAQGTAASWFGADTLEAYWNWKPNANPHPPFYKILGGLGWAAFHRVMGDYPAFRLSSAALFSIVVGALYLWGARAGGSAVSGVGAALALALMPRVVGDGHVGATDMPLTAFWTLSALFFWRAVRGERWRDVLLFGAMWGFALATKFTGMLLPVPLAVWALVHHRRRFVTTLLVGGLVAAALMLVLNPYLWPDPVGRVLAFVDQSTTRAEWAPVWTYYLGRIYPFVLPWHHSIVLTLVTVPLPLLVLAGAGALRLREEGVRPLVSLCLIQIVFWHGLMALPSSPGHDGVRLFLPQFPFIALLAGLGFGAAWDRIGTGLQGAREWGSRWGRAALAALALVPAACQLAHAHPLELAYYNEVVGGVPGAYARGFETTYWFDAATPGFLRRLERHVPPGGRVWAHPAPWHYSVLQQAGLLRGDIAFTDSLPAPYLLLMTRQGMFGPFEWRLHKHVPPIAAEVYDGVPLMALYRWR